MSRDEKIEEILKYFYREHTVTLGDYIYSAFGNSNDMDNRKECDIIIDFMVKNELISVGDYNSKILPNGIHIAENGGWLKYRKKGVEINAKEKIKKVIEFKKLKNEYTLSKWQKKTYWWLFTFSIIGFFLAVISIILQIRGIK